jgi:hypothetical protein
MAAAFELTKLREATLRALRRMVDKEPVAGHLSDYIVDIREAGEEGDEPDADLIALADQIEVDHMAVLLLDTEARSNVSGENVVKWYGLMGIEVPEDDTA